MKHEAQKAQIAEREQSAEKFMQQQLRLAFSTPEGRNALGYIGVKFCGFLGRADTEQERIRQNLFADILEELGLGGDKERFELIQQFMDYPVR